MPERSTGSITTRDAVRDYTNRGLTPREIAQLLGISTQRVYVHLRKLELDPVTRSQAEEDRW